ncbi:MAG: ribonuclease R [Flavobacteriales bacterium MED-G15]|nr:MAG: ribonuclease R [Flavobacteriales bacterium MED-G15]
MSKKKKIDRNIQAKVLSVFKASSSKTFNYKQIASKLSVNDTQGRNAIIKSLGKLTAQKILKQTSPGKYTLSVDQNNYREGIIDVNSSGNGYLLMPEGVDDIFIARRNLNRAFNGDLVLVYPLNRKKSGRKEGEVVEVLERKQQNFIGILDRKKEFGFVNTRGNKMYTDFFIEATELKDFNDGEKVVVEFKEWPKRASSPFGKIKKSLGHPGELNTEMHAIMFDYGFPEEFPSHVEKFTQKLNTSIEENEIARRRDFRNKTTFTIDPVTAKDFDDAISFFPLPDNKTEIGIHIADVSHYVQPNSVLDEEAYDRATSVYLVDRVVPMLPEMLSNGVCSLRPREEKYTFSAVFVVDENMQIEKEWFGKTVIFSDHRFSYDEVQFILDTEDNKVNAEVSLTDKSYTVSEEIFSALIKLDVFAKKLRKTRMSKGALSFDRVEVKFNLDSQDNPESIYFKSSKDAHKLVEEFMLLANRRVAEFIGKQKPKKPFVYRVHDLPDEDKLINLKNIASNLGYQLNLESKNINGSLNNLLQESNGKREQQLIDTLTIRSMSKAVYTTENIGHYGLAFEHYTHFTSPIRRYPDVLVHRLVASYMNEHNQINPKALEEACIHSSNREQLATKAERDSIKYMQVKFMEDKIDQSFNGVISGVTDRGIYVEIIENKCEGLVKISEIKGDYFIYDEQSHSLVGEKTQKNYQLGDLVQITVKKADLLRRQLDFILTEPTE